MVSISYALVIASALDIDGNHNKAYDYAYDADKKQLVCVAHFLALTDREFPSQT